MTASIDQGDGVVVTPPADAAPVPSLTASGVALTITAGADIPSYGTGAAAVQHGPGGRRVRQASAHPAQRPGRVGYPVHHRHAGLRVPGGSADLAGEDPTNFEKIEQGHRSRPSPLLQASALRWSRSTTSTSAATTTVRSATLWPASTRTVAACASGAAPTLGEREGGRHLGPDWDPTAKAPRRPPSRPAADANCADPQDIVPRRDLRLHEVLELHQPVLPGGHQGQHRPGDDPPRAVAEMNLLSQIFARRCVQPDHGSAVTDKKVGVHAVKFDLRLSQRGGVLCVAGTASNSNAPMRAILPSWVLDAMVADLALQMPGDGLETLSVSEARINGLFRDAGINVTWSLDAWKRRTAKQAAASDSCHRVASRPRSGSRCSRRARSSSSTAARSTWVCSAT